MGSPPMPGIPGTPRPPATPAMRSRSSSLLLVIASFTAVLEHVDLLRIDRGRVDLHRAQLLPAGDDHLHRAAAGAGLDRRLPQLFLDLRHLRLHLLRHLGDLGDVHGPISW
jgi:hypothetical protein